MSWPILNWTASAGATSYTVARDGTVVYTHPNGNAGTWDDIALDAPGLGGTYSYRMTAFNAAGSTLSSSNPQSVTTTTAAGAPTNLVAEGGNTTATVTFTAPPNGGLPIQNYTMDALPSGAGVWFSVGSTPSIQATGLTNGVSYTFRVTAFNGQDGPWSVYSNAVVPSSGAATVPVAPTIGTASAPTAGQATVTFTPGANGGSPILDYQITSSPGGVTATVAGSPGVIPGLTNGTAYTFTVQARNAVGYSLASAASNSVTPPYAAIAPGAPTIGAATGGAPGTGQATITFTAPAYNGGPPPTSYTVTSSPGGIAASGAGSPLVVSGLSGGTPYTFTVTATNANGTGPASAASNSVTLVTVPAAPVIGTATALTMGGISVTFVPPNNGGSPITSYTVTTSPGGYTATGTSSPITVYTPPGTYTATVRATNAIGQGPASAASNSVTTTISFSSQLTTTLVPQIAAGSPTPTFVRATAAYESDFQGILRQAVSGEARFQGARRVANAVSQTENLSHPQWLKGDASTTVSKTATDPLGVANNAWVCVISNGGPGLYNGSGPGIKAGNSVISVWLRAQSGTPVVYLDFGGQGSVLVTLSTTWTRYSVAYVGTANCTFVIRTDFPVSKPTVTIEVWQPMMESVVGNSNVNPSEYVSVGVLSAPWHGAGGGQGGALSTDGIKYFSTTNGNSVASNVVTEATGTAISTSTLLGYLAEGARTNLCLESQTLVNASWTKDGLAVTADTTAAPDGTTTGDTITNNGVNNQHRYYNATPLTVTLNPVTFSSYYKRGTNQWVQLCGIFTGTFWANFDLLNGVVGNIGAGTTATIAALPNGWYRCSITFTPTGTTGAVQGAVLESNLNAGNPSFVGTGLTCIAWGAQAEQASFASSYIPTTTVAVTRNADALAYAAAGNTLGTAGTVYEEITVLNTSNIGLYFFNANVLVDTPLLYKNGGGILKSFDGTNDVGNLPLTASTAVQKIAVAYSGSRMINAKSGVLSTAGAFDGAINYGVNFSTDYPTGREPNGTIRNINIWPVALPDATLIAITTP